MILLKIDADRVGPDPLERDPPRSVDCKRMPLGPAVQHMQPPTRKPQIVKRFRPMERLKTTANPLDQIGTKAARIVAEKEIAQGLAAKAHDHEAYVKYRYTNVKHRRKPPTVFRAAKVALHFKQWGGTNKKCAGRDLDGRTWDDLPGFRDNALPHAAAAE